MPTRIMRWFKADHLRDGAPKDVSVMVGNLGKAIDEALGDGPEKSAGLRKLLEAKDCFVRQAIEDQDAIG